MRYLKSFGVDTGKGRYHEEVIYSTALIYNILNTKITAYLKEFNLSPGKFNILLTIKHQGGKKGISQVDISKHLIVTPSNMTRLLDKLEKEGLVSRGAQEGDRRVNIIKISRKGADLLKAAWPGYTEQIQYLVAQMSRANQKVLSGLLIEWLSALIRE